MNENLDPELPVEKSTEEVNIENASTVDAASEAAVQEAVEDKATDHSDAEEDAQSEATTESSVAKDTPLAKEETTEKLEEEEPDVEMPEEKAIEKHASLSKEEVIEKLKNLSLQKEIPPRSEVEALKQAFYKLRSANVETQKAEFIEAGNDPAAFVPSSDPSEDVVKTFLNDIKEKRANNAAEEERLKEDNYNKKLGIIDSIKNLTESSDDFNKLYKEFKDLQQKWNEITLIPQSKVKELWKSYQIYTEKFYDLIKINNEFRDYDFKKNLELKNAIIESVEKLLEDSDAVSAFHQLQNFHHQWREIGPVSRELREETWTRFKDASTAINKKYQTHFESLKGREEENLAEKTAICEQLKTIDYSVLSSFKEWDEKSKEVIELQAKWKTIGFVPKKVNTQIFEEFRSLCDAFFEKKSEFFKGVREDMDSNLEKKRALAEQAVALKDSTDWKSTTDKLIAIQKEWKTIGPVPRKFSDIIWKEFVTACDYFFEQKKKNDSSQKTEEQENLTAKKDIIEKIKNVDITKDPSEVIAEVRDLADQWHKIGFVPFREKDKIYKEFHQAVDAHYDRLKIDKTERRFESFKSNIKDNLSKQDNPRRALYREREHLMHQFNKVKADLQTYENNMNFLSISSKGGGGLLKDINHKIEDLKNELDLLVKKVETIDEQLNELE
ncbi:DUF349 domain-containing protein [Dysgonomonas sp. BGC7]|uniref:DUF349 domain-containing protein n=1 Tax=Dysgonomonas sp. BGC7 TaxID=1658008 RepID=UPI000AE968CE|nr:DUF349 domain-containing protein [Dysgonomonas sp. BGC7]MBD8389238.1 DUF349 domain-containing protein [Dysgonomonas sp. BGC7]